MKITVTYEKKDILRLLQKDMRAQGIRVRQGTTLVYKGALQVTIQVDTEDEAPEEVPSPDPSVDQSAEKTPEQLPTAAEEAVKMGSVLGASKQLVMTQPGKFESRPPRPLEISDRMQESSDFPED